MATRLELKKRVQDTLNKGYTTHRVMNRILLETSNEIVDVLMDEIEELKKELENGRNANAPKVDAQTKDIKVSKDGRKDAA